jgi:hypothetical protein
MMLSVKEWTAKFYAAGIRRELAEMAGRIAVQVAARERADLIAAARAAGLTLRELALAFGLTAPGVRYITSKEGADERNMSTADEPTDGEER